MGIYNRCKECGRDWFGRSCPVCGGNVISATIVDSPRKGMGITERPTKEKNDAITRDSIKNMVDEIVDERIDEICDAVAVKIAKEYMQYPTELTEAIQVFVEEMVKEYLAGNISKIIVE